MGVFSRYKAVLEADDNPMTVKTALQLINAELDEYLGGIQGEFDDDTRFAITWFEQNGLKAGDYGTANNIATARGISVDSVKHAGIIESQAGEVRILKRAELDSKWEPQAVTHNLTVWECLQYLVRQHEEAGVSYETALLLRFSRSISPFFIEDFKHFSITHFPYVVALPECNAQELLKKHLQVYSSIWVTYR